jgi:hypothetical protein
MEEMIRGFGDPHSHQPAHCAARTAVGRPECTR